MERKILTIATIAKGIMTLYHGHYIDGEKGRLQGGTYEGVGGGE